MGERGLTLVELMMVVAIVGTLVAIGGLQLAEMNKKAAVEQQVKTIYSKLMEVRVEAMYTKSPRTVKVASGSLTVYPNATGLGTASSVLAVKYPTVMATGLDRVNFNSKGIMLSDAGPELAICVEPENAVSESLNIDSIVVSAVKIHMGKRKSGGDCVPASITQK